MASDILPMSDDAMSSPILSLMHRRNDLIAFLMPYSAMYSFP